MIIENNVQRKETHERKLQGESSRLQLGERMWDDADALSDRNDCVNGNVGEFVGLTAGPRDLERIDLAPFAEAEMDTWIAGGHVAGAALGLIDLNDGVGGEFENGTDTVSIGFCANQKHLKPMIRRSSIAENLRGIATAVDCNSNLAIVEKVRGCKTAGRHGAIETGCDSRAASCPQAASMSSPRGLRM